MSCEDCLSRREFLSKSTLAVAGAAALAAGCGDGQFGPTDLRDVTGGQTTGLTLKVASVPALATVGQLVRISPASAYVAVKRTGATTFSAIRVICTHEGCETNVQGTILVCPCHNSRYDSDGKVTKQPDGGGSATNLPTFATKYDATTDILTIG